MPRNIAQFITDAYDRGDIFEPLDEDTLDDVRRGSWSAALTVLVENHVLLGDIPRFLAAAGMAEAALRYQCRMCLASAAVAAPQGVKWAFSALRSVAEDDRDRCKELMKRHAAFWRALGLYGELAAVADSGGDLYPLLRLTWKVCGSALWDRVGEYLEQETV